MSGFHRPDRLPLAPSAKGREVFDESHEGVSSIPLRTACEADLLRHGWQPRPVNLISGVAASRGSNGFSLRTTASWLPHHEALRDTIIPLVRSKGFPPRANDLQ